MQDLRFATLATVSRCGMVWFSEDVLSIEMIFQHYLARLRHIPVLDSDEDTSLLSATVPGKQRDEADDEGASPILQVGPGNVVTKALRVY